ncbi:MAG TPA: endopeptidase La [Candidatus Marinimicrobia bacterium]|nr:endopeptidase La [Candidatus Neomarinimicrobiota bacterium]
MTEYEENVIDESQPEPGVVLASDIYPDSVFIVPLENRPIFPGITLPLSFQGEEVVAAFKELLEKKNYYFGVSFIEEKDERNYYKSTLYPDGTLMKILRLISVSDDSIQVLAHGMTRMHKVRSLGNNLPPRWKLKYHADEKAEMTEEIKAYTMAVISSVKELIKANPLMQEQLQLVVAQMNHEKPGLIMDIIAMMLSAEAHRLQELLATYDLIDRAERLLLLLREEIQVTQLQDKIRRQIEEKMSQQQKEFFLREQLKAIKKELGLEKDDKSTELDKLQQRLQGLTLSEEAYKTIQEEMDKLRILEPASPEYHVTRNYLNWLTELPWGKYSQENLDIQKAKKILNNQHYGLNDVKQLILESISTVIMRKKVAGNIICLVGPPGVGKTSIGHSIAEALGRKFYRFSVGGMRDEAEIKGHRRTYIGAMPGKIIQALKQSGSANPVLMLDEIDKVGTSFQGDPASALLEVLDPEQNHAFLDHYLDVRFDLSNILFITTANQLDTIPRPLLDRMEIIKLSGYILEEKIEIAKRFLIPRQRKNHGLAAKDISITDAALTAVIDRYAREAGVRSLENQIKKIMRQTTLRLAEGESGKISVTMKNLSDFLGKPVFGTEQLYQKAIPGVALGLAWTAMGGTTLYIEATAVKGKARGFRQTGQLGKVMQESTEIAYSYIRSLLSHTESSKVKSFFDDHFVHLHVPAGATPKDGPSAGITMALALYSLATNKAVRKGIAMTGELTLTGHVLPIGGVKEKTIAARRVGIRELIFPAENEKDFSSLPDYIREGLTIHYVQTFEDLLQAVCPLYNKKAAQSGENNA